MKEILCRTPRSMAMIEPHGNVVATEFPLGAISKTREYHMIKLDQPTTALMLPTHNPLVKSKITRPELMWGKGVRDEVLIICQWR